MEERKFVCKYCSKRFPCGKSLGGHIRTHMSSEHLVQVQLQSNEERSNAAAMFKRKRDLNLGSGGGDDLSYGLRENPKKTTRFVHSNANTSQMEKFCKECGKGFPSLKALCGHMACHSEKDKGTTNRLFENNYSASGGVTEKQKLVLDDSQSDTETSVPMNPRRSKRMRFKKISNHQPPSSSSLPFPNGSSSVSEVEQDQEELARCLMLLSKDSSYKGRFGLVTDSSDNNSVVLEAKSPSPMNYGKNSLTNGYELVEKKLHKDVKLKMKMKTDEIGYDSDNSDSGYFRYGPKKVDSNDSSDEFGKDEVKSSTVGYFSGFEDHGIESRKMVSRGRSRNSEFKKLVLEEGHDFDSRKRPNYDSIGQNLVVGGSRRKTVNGFGNGGEIYEHGGKGWNLKRERDNGSDDSAYESDENSTDTDSYPAPKTQSSSRNLNGKIKKSSKGKKKKMKSKKSKEHECPICNKIFRSGQALGGHKRSHFIGGSEENTLVIRPSAPPPPPPPAVPCLIDLNLPAPVDE